MGRESMARQDAMDCQGVRKYTEMWIDEEMDASSREDFAAHLELCRPCRERVEGETRLERAIRDRVPKAPMPEDAWARVARRIDREARPTRRGAIAALVVSLAACAVFAFTWWAMWSRQRPDLETAALGIQRRFAKGTLAMDLRTNSADEVEQFLHEKLGMEVDLQHAMSGKCGPHDVRFEGASIVKLSDVPCACLAYRCCGEPVTVVIMKRDDLHRFPEMADAVKKLGPRLHDEVGSTNIEVRITRRATPTGTVEPWLACIVGAHPIEDLAAVFEKI